MLSTKILDAQREYEDCALAVGAEKYHERQELKAGREGFDRRDNVTKLIRGAVPVLSEALSAWLVTAGAAKGRKPSGYKAIAMLDQDLVAYSALSRIFRSLSDGGRIQDIVIAIGRSVQVELEAQALASECPKDAKRFADMAEGEAKESILRRRHEALTADADVSLGWARTTQAGVGQSILAVALLALRDIFIKRTVKDPRGMAAVVSLTDEAVTLLADMADAASWMKPPLPPMLTLPRPWTGMGSGCYHDVRLSKLVPLVRTYSGEHKRLLKAAIADGSMQETIDSVNAIQDTRWAIDDRVLPIIKWCREEGLKPSKSFPTTKLPELPTKIDKAEWALLPVEKRSALSRGRKAIRDIRGASAIDNKVCDTDIETAEFLMAENDFFCLPHSLDFRGRVYAVPYFNHQRSDHLKALFRFADKLPLGPDGGRWLMIHLANCGDFEKMSKKTFDQRANWVKRNEVDIRMCAEDPVGMYPYWSKADAPFCFLQACFEYDEWALTGFSEWYCSSIAIAADGSCSGLQHYSAITRAEKEAYHVNLTPRDTVGDIYQVVADAAVPSLQRSAAESLTANGRLASIVLAQGFDRGDVKRNVMTYFYGSGKFGMRDQHMEDTMRPIADEVALGKVAAHPYAILTERTDKETGDKSWNLDGGYSCAQVMAAHTYQAVVTVAPKADEAATWIQGIAARLAHEGHSMIWRTPTGMPVVQRYSEYTSKCITMWLYDRDLHVPTSRDKTDTDGNTLARVQLLIREAPTKRIEKKRMRSASSPNVIHSMDGAHLQRSVAMGHEAGIRHFAMIHDSFGTHAGNMTLFAATIREAFIATYANYCPLTELDTYARSVLSDESIEKLEPIPAKGELDLESIKDSLYAFA